MAAGTIPPPFLGSVREEQIPFKGALREGRWRAEIGASQAPPGISLAQGAQAPVGAAPLDPLTEADIARHEAEAAATPNIKPEDVPAEAMRRILSEHSSRLSPEDKRVSLRINPDTGSQRITGNYFVPGDPVHERLLAGVSDADRQKLPILSRAISRGDPFSFSYFSAPEEEPGAGAKPTAESRAYEQGLSTAGQRAAGGQGQLQRATMIPQRLVVAKPEVDQPARVMLEGFANDAAMNNAEHTLSAAQSAGVPIPYRNTGFDLQRDLGGYIQNQIHGYRGDGSGPIVDAQGQPNHLYQSEIQKPPGQQYVPHLLDRPRAEFINTAMNILPSTKPVPTTQFAQKAQDLSRVNQAFIGQEQGANSLRETLDRKLPEVAVRNKKGDITRRVPWSKGTLEPTYRAYRLEHIRDVAPPLLSQSIRATIAGPHAIPVAPIALHTAAEFQKRPLRETGRPGGGVENPEIGSFAKTPVGEPETEPGLLERAQPAPIQEWTPEEAANINPRMIGASYPHNQPNRPQPAIQPPTEPTEPPPQSREFTSPNIKEGLNYPGAVRGLRTKLHAEARDFHGRVEQALANHLGTEPAEVHDAIGDWSDGAENSTTTTWKDQPWELRRQAAALKGLHSAQKNVIAFEHRPEGEHSLYTLRFPSEDPAKVRNALTDSGIQFRTIEPAQKGSGETVVHVVDTDGGAREGIEKLIKGGHVDPEQIEERSGHAEFLGDPEGASREEGARNYRGVLQAARDQASQRGEGLRAGTTLPWFHGLDQEAEQNYRDLSRSREIRGPLEEMDLRAAAADRANLSPEELKALRTTRAKAQQWAENNPEVDPLSAHYFLHGHEQFPEEVGTKEDIGKFFGQRNKRLDYSKPADRERAVDALTHDVMHAIAGGSEAPNWYGRTVDRSLRKVAEVAPEIASNPDDAQAFKLAVAVASQGQSVHPNFQSGYLAYRHWKQTGEFPTDPAVFGGGAKNTAMIENFQKLNRLWKTHGTEGLRKILETPLTMRELRDQYGVNPAGESLDHTMEGAALLGPKIGSFYNNLNKRFHSVTFDLWASRTMNRMRGDMFKFSDEAMRKDSAERDSHLSQFRNLLDSGALNELGDAQVRKMRAEATKLENIPEGKMTRERALKLAPTIAEWAKDAHGAYARGTGGRSYPPELKTPQAALAKNIDLNLTDLSDAPRNASERQHWRQIFNGLRENLEEHGLKLSNADLQAVLWYQEQRLFQSAGSRLRPNEDYLDASHRLVRLVKSGQLPALHEPMRAAA
jgi:hypothetical protein